MKIYRVYESFHDPSESGTNEYGYYSTLELAKTRAKEVWAKKYPDIEYEEYDTSLYHRGTWDNISISIEQHEVDQDIAYTNIGYT